jgi:hypothetical protein
MPAQEFGDKVAGYMAEGDATAMRQMVARINHAVLGEGRDTAQSCKHARPSHPLTVPRHAV